MTPTTAVRPPRADAVRNRERVIAAARKVMARKGIDAQMDEIAREAKVGVGTVYRHFPNKDDLVEALAAARFERLAELAHEALSVDDPWVAFEGLIRAGAEIQCADRALSEVLVSRSDTMIRAAEAVGMIDLVARVMSRAQEAGLLRADAEPEDVPMMMCALAGTHRHPMSDTDRYVAIALDGLRAPGATPLAPRAA
jgi:AcrR family transcriptional regulator